MAKKNLFIVGLDELNLAKLKRLPQARECDFHPALDLALGRRPAPLERTGEFNRAAHFYAAGIRGRRRAACAG